VVGDAQALMLVTVNWQKKLKLACVEVTEFGAVTCKAPQNVEPLPQASPGCQVVVTVCVVTSGLKVTVSVGALAPSDRSQWYLTVPPAVPAGTLMVAVNVKIIGLVQAP